MKIYQSSTHHYDYHSHHYLEGPFDLDRSAVGSVGSRRNEDSCIGLVLGFHRSIT